MSTSLEILQIVAFAKKTGTLKVEGNVARGAVLFRDGMVSCALSSSTTPILSAMAGRTFDQSQAMLLEDEIRIALRELVGLREGRFEFVISAEPPTHFEGMDVRKFLLAEGVDPQALMLELAREIDTERTDSSSLLETSDAVAPPENEPTDVEPPSLADGDVTVLLVDDEPQVLAIVREELEGAGCTVETATGAENALALVDKIVESGQPMILVTDVAMPSSGGDTFEGGIEVIEYVRKSRGKTPIILMTESLSSEARERAISLGVRKVVFKPALTKLDANEYGADLRSFATVVRRELGALMEDAKQKAETSTVPDLNHAVMFDFLKTMTNQLSHPANGIATHDPPCRIEVLRTGRTISRQRSQSVRARGTPPRTACQTRHRRNSRHLVRASGSAPLRGSRLFARAARAQPREKPAATVARSRKST